MKKVAFKVNTSAEKTIIVTALSAILAIIFDQKRKSLKNVRTLSSAPKSIIRILTRSSPKPLLKTLQPTRLKGVKMRALSLRS